MIILIVGVTIIMIFYPVGPVRGAPVNTQPSEHNGEDQGDHLVGRGRFHRWLVGSISSYFLVWLYLFVWFVVKLFGCLVSFFFILLFGVMSGYLIVCF